MASSATQHQAPPGSHTPLTPSQGLLVGVHVFGEIQVDEAGVGSMDQGSKELPGWGCEPCGGGPRGAAAPHTAQGWRGTEGRAHCQDPLHGTHSIQRTVCASQAEVGERVAVAEEALQAL